MITTLVAVVVAGAKAQYKGVGAINGTGSFKFLLAAIDADANAATLRALVDDASDEVAAAAIRADCATEARRRRLQAALDDTDTEAFQGSAHVSRA